MARKGDTLNRAYGYGAVVVGLALFVLLAGIGLQPYIAWLIGWSVATFLLYGLDKLQARRGGWRVPEAVLHGLALVGGAAGGWTGMLLFRHKVRKPIFPVVLLVATAIQGYLLFRWVLTG